jgi:hypothetical protein
MFSEILSEITSIRTHSHDSIQLKVKKILQRYGLVANIEYPVRYDLRNGRIDVVSTNPLRIGIEIDNDVPRKKSISKLNQFNGDVSILILKGRNVSKRVARIKTRCKLLNTKYFVLDLCGKKLISYV